MKAFVDDVLIHTFCDGSLTGSPQVFHFFKSEPELHSFFTQYQVENEMDHSFIYLSSPSSAQVRWKNKAGPIQFCGSGAYALAWMVSNEFDANEFALSSESREFTSHATAGEVFLEMPNLLPQKVSDSDNDWGHLFLDSDSGIYFLQIFDKNILGNDSWVKDFLEREHPSDIHGFCVFHWDVVLNSGKLRYFTPWHGRDEDHVTGSIHQYLTPLVQQLYCQRQQSWTQASKSGGRVLTLCSGNSVRLNGNCSMGKL